MGEEEVPVQEIIESFQGSGEKPHEEQHPFLVLPEIIEEDLIENPTGPDRPADAGMTPEKPGTGKPVDYYGIYVVRSGDNLWNIHFAFLREYFASRGIDLSTAADEPADDNTSSGVGRILKYAENMVHIFNLKTRRLSRDLNLLHPLEKVVIFNVSHLHRILGSFDPRDGTRIRLTESGDLLIEE